jgi:hypothetical protein
MALSAASPLLVIHCFGGAIREGVRGASHVGVSMATNLLRTVGRDDGYTRGGWVAGSWSWRCAVEFPDLRRGEDALATLFLKRGAWETVETWRRGEPSGSAVAAPDEAVAELPDMPACVTGTETCGTRSPSA